MTFCAGANCLCAEIDIRYSPPNSVNGGFNQALFPILKIKIRHKLRRNKVMDFGGKA